MPHSPATDRYPWYDLAHGAELQQGDIFLEYPIIEVAERTTGSEAPQSEQATQMIKRNLIVMTQSCDLIVRDNGASNAAEVLFCPLYFKSELREDRTYGSASNWEEARKGRHPRYHVLNKCDLADHGFDFCLVDLSRILSVNIERVREFAESYGDRARLNPPYREHLSQAFARFFMRVGLPVDIAPFR